MWFGQQYAVNWFQEFGAAVFPFLSEGIMAETKRLTETARSTPSSPRRNIPYVPEEIIFEILSRCPAEFLYDRARFVCKTWANMIRNPYFTRAHVRRHANSTNTVGFLFVPEPYNDPHTNIYQFLEMTEGNINLTDFRLHFPGRMLASSHGVALYYRRENTNEVLYVVNELTKQVVKLPQPPDQLIQFNFRRNSIAYIPCTGEIKVITWGKDMKEEYDWYILTVGSEMSWRIVDWTTYNPHAIIITVFVGCGLPTSVGGVVYWQFSYRIVATDLCDEIIHCFFLPGTAVGSRLMEVGNHLGWIEYTAALRPQHIWILKDLHRKEWTKLYTLREDIGAGLLKPIGWLDNQQILLFEHYISRASVFRAYGVVPEIVAYNVRTGISTSYRRSYHSLDNILPVHSNSLISW